MYRFANKITQITQNNMRDINFAGVCFTNFFVVSQLFLSLYYIDNLNNGVFTMKHKKLRFKLGYKALNYKLTKNQLNKLKIDNWMHSP
jgi:hypothetical protein